MVDLTLETCASVTLTADDTVVLNFDGTDFALPADSVTGAAELEIGVEAFLAVLFSGSIDLTTDAVTVEAELLGTEGCEPVVPGTLTIAKETSPAGSTETFTFRAVVAAGGGVGEGAFELSDGETNISGALGTHTITEMLTDAQVGAGWTLVGVTCDDAGVAITDDAVEVVIEAGDDVTCTFENALAPAGDGGAATPPPTPPVTVLPDAAVSGTRTSPASGTAFLAILMLLSVGMLGYVNIVRRESR